MSFLSGIKNFIKTEILGVQETDTKNQVSNKKNTNPIIECKTEAPVDKLEKKSTQTTQSNKTQKGMSRKAMEATLENTPSAHINIKKMLKNGLIEKVTGMTKADFEKLTPQQKNQIVTAIKTSVIKFDELIKEGKFSNKANPEEIVTTFAQILSEALKSGDFKDVKDFEKAMGDITKELGKDFDKKSKNEQRRILKEHRLADEQQMLVELNEAKKLPKAKRIAAEARIRRRHHHIRRGQFVDITAQYDSKTTVHSLIILDSKDMQYGAQTILKTRCNPLEKTKTADYATYSITKELISDFKEVGDEVKGEVLEGYTQTFMEQKSLSAVKAYQADYKQDRDNYEAILEKQKRGEKLTSEEKALLSTMRPEYYTATAKGIGAGALNNVNMTNDEKAEFIRKWDNDAKNYSDYKTVTEQVKKQLDTNPDLKDVKNKIESMHKEQENLSAKTKNNEFKTNQEILNRENNYKNQTSVTNIIKNQSKTEKKSNKSKITVDKKTNNYKKENFKNNENYTKITNANTSVITQEIETEGVHKTLNKYGSKAVKVIIDNPMYTYLKSTLITELRSYDLKTLQNISSNCSDSAFVFISKVVNKDYVAKLKENREHTRGLCFNAEKQIQNIKGNYETIKKHNI